MRLWVWLRAFDLTFWLCPADVVASADWRWRLHLWVCERMGDAADWGQA